MVYPPTPEPRYPLEISANFISCKVVIAPGEVVVETPIPAGYRTELKRGTYKRLVSSHNACEPDEIYSIPRACRWTRKDVQL